MTENHDIQSGELLAGMNPDATVPIYLSERVVRVGKVDFQVVSHFCGWEGIERKLGALMLEDIFDGGGGENFDADG